MTPQTALQPMESNDLLAEWTPESLRVAMQREQQMRIVVLEYCKAAMKEGHHFYNLPGQQNRKPALSKEGALNLCSLFKVTPSPDAVTETFHDDGHYTARARCHITDRAGNIVATGDGLCTSRESKYAYRWCFGSEVPADIDKETLKQKTGTGRNNRPYTQYQVPNQDLADIYNTVLKMAGKRAMVDAVLKLPLVSELFTQDLDEQVADAVQRKQETAQTRRQSEKAPEPAPQDESKLADLRIAVNDRIKEMTGGNLEEVNRILNGRIVNQMGAEPLTRLLEELNAA